MTALPESIADARRTLIDGGATAVSLATAYRERIAEHDGDLAAFVRLAPDWEAACRESDRRLEQRQARPLEGIPLAIKDNIATAGLETGCGSAFLAGYIPARDATVVGRLVAAGAVVLGKTNLDEFGMGSSTETSVHGATRNPWDRDRVPGGSSGGSAAAVAARFASGALGSDTGGSVRQPAAFCGVVGLKPTYGRVSRSGLVAFGSSLDQVGPMAARVEDTARLLQAIAGPDPLDMTCSSRPLEDYVGACSREVKGMRVGLPSECLGEGTAPEIVETVRRAAGWLESAGARCEEVSLPHARFAIPTYYLVATAEAASNLARFDGVRYGRRVTSDPGLAEFYRRNRGTGFGAEVKRRIMLGTYALSAGYYDRYYGRATDARRAIARELTACYDGGCDALLTPVTPTPPFRLGERIRDPLAMYLSDLFTVTANLAGLPALALPAGSTAKGLPLGVQLTSPAFREADLFRAGAAIEREFTLPACPL